jgi:hypothetical protein
LRNNSYARCDEHDRLPGGYEVRTPVRRMRHRVTIPDALSSMEMKLGKADPLLRP